MQIHRTLPQQGLMRLTGRFIYMLIFVAAILGGLPGAHGATAAEVGPCEPGLVQRQEPFPGVVPVAYRPAATTGAPVLLEWLGHSSFLLTSPAGLRLLTDPNDFHPLRLAPDLVTVSNLHMTHAAVSQVPGSPQILWGLTPDRGWNRIMLTRQDVSLFNLPSYASRTEPEDSPIQNSIFVFHIGGLCIVHLGNLRHPLTLQQLQRIGQPDVVMIAVDGQWTMSYADVLTVLTQLQPRLVIPMHVDFPPQVATFVQFTAGRYPVRRVEGLTLVLSRHLLPASTEIVVFSGRRER